MIHAATGVSSGVDAYAAAVEAATIAQKKIQDVHEGGPHVAILFASAAYDQASVHKGLRSVIGGDVEIVGASTAGEITENGPVQRHSIAVMLLASDTARFYVGVGEDIAQDPYKAGIALAEDVQARAGEDTLELLIVFPDVLAGNGSEISRGVLEKMGAHFPLVGGAAGDNFRFEKTYQYAHGAVHTGAVTGLGIAGDFQFGVGVKHGWIPIGVPMMVTRSQGSVLHELDGQPAISVYEDHFGKDIAAELKENKLAKLAILYPLGIRVEGSEEMLIRNPLYVDEKGSITCAGAIPKGSEIRLMVGNREEAIRGAMFAVANAMEDIEGKDPRAILLFNSSARSKLLAESAQREISVIQQSVGREVPLLGFYTYGELAPLEGEVRDIEKRNTTFHNETVVVVILTD